MLTVEDSFCQYCMAYLIPNKEAYTVAKVLMDHHFNIYGLPNKIHQENERELFSEFKIQRTTTPPYNLSSNPVEHIRRILTAMLGTRGPRVKESRDLWLNASVFAYNTTVSSSTKVTPHYTMFRPKVALPVDWVFSTPSVEKRTMHHWTGDMMEERKRAYKSMREVQGSKRVQRNAQMYKPLTQNIRA